MKAALPLVFACLLLLGWSAYGAKTKSVAFDAAADRALAAMEKRASALGMQGVALVAFAPGDVVRSWSSKMRVVGNLRKEPSEKEPSEKDPSEKDPVANLLAIAYAKAAEMADTLKDSGQAGRPKLTGENGWPGGVIRQASRGHLIAAFSGGASEDDVLVSEAGVEVLAGQL